MGQSRTLPPRMQNMYQRSHSWNGAGQPWQRPSSSSSPAVAGERTHHHHHNHHRGERSERGERERGAGGGGGAPAIHVLPPRMRAVKAPRHQSSSNTAIDGFGLVAPPSPPSPSDPLGLGRNLDQLNAARPSISRSPSYNNEASSSSYPPLLNIPAPNVLYATGMSVMDHQRTSQLSPDAPVFQPRFGMPASSAPVYHQSSAIDEFPFPFVGGGGSSNGSSYQGGDAIVGNIGDMTGVGAGRDISMLDSLTLGGVSFSSSPSTSPTRTSPTSGSPPKLTRLPPIAPPPMTKPDGNTPPPPAYLVNFLASKFGPTAPAVPATPVQGEPSMVLYDSALSSSSQQHPTTITLPVSIPVVPGVTPKMVPNSSSTMSLVPTVPILKLPTPPNKRSSSSPLSPSPSPSPRPAPSPPVAIPTSTTPKTTVEVAPRRPSPPSRSSYIVADMLLNRIRSSPLRPGLGPRRATSPASTSPISRSCLSKEVIMDDVVMMSLSVSS